MEITSPNYQRVHLNLIFIIQTLGRRQCRDIIFEIVPSLNVIPIWLPEKRHASKIGFTTWALWQFDLRKHAKQNSDLGIYMSSMKLHNCTRDWFLWDKETNPLQDRWLRALPHDTIHKPWYKHTTHIQWLI